jgi:hypothetical protein
VIMATAPLLVEGEDEAWEALEDGSDTRELSMKELIDLAPDKVLDHLKSGSVRKLGSFTVTVLRWIRRCSCR